MEIFYQYSEFFFLPGIIVGVIGHIFGLGGGILMVPLISAAGFSMHTAISSSLAVIVFNSFAIAHRKLDSNLIYLPITPSVELMGVLGAGIGGLVALRLDGNVLATIFAGFTLMMAVIVVWRTTLESADEQITSAGDESWEFYDHELGKKVPMKAENRGHHLVIGLCGGLLSAILGIGSGAFMVPTLVVFNKLPIKVAAATSSYVSGVFAACAMFMMREFVSWEIAVPLMFGVLIGATLSERYLATIRGRSVAWGLAVLLFIIGIRMLR